MTIGWLRKELWGQAVGNKADHEDPSVVLAEEAVVFVNKICIKFDPYFHSIKLIFMFQCSILIFLAFLQQHCHILIPCLYSTHKPLQCLSRSIFFCILLVAIWLANYLHSIKLNCSLKLIILQLLSGVEGCTISSSCKQCLKMTFSIITPRSTVCSRNQWLLQLHHWWFEKVATIYKSSVTFVIANQQPYSK